MLNIKRAYEKRTDDDGTRIYVDRLWPRGLSKQEFIYDEWLKVLSPSDDLRRWFGHDPGRFAGFRERYLHELSDADKAEELRRIAELARARNVTLIYSAKDTEHNNAVILAEVIKGMMTDRAAG